jgi:Concanavalin A-like lectin/glucanases superfamily
MPLNIPVAYRAPFDFGGPCYVDQRLPGESILDIVRSVPNLPRNFTQVGYVCINGEIVPRELWSFVRPKPPRPELHIAVTLHVSLHGGGGGRGTLKTIGALVAAIALIVITQGIATGAILGGLSGGVAGALGVSAAAGAQILAGAVGIAGALAISALTAPPVSAAGIADTSSTNQEQAEAAGATGNILDRGGSVPRVLGTRKVFPPLACEPVVELIDQDEVVEALFILNGPHLLTDIRLDGTPIVDAEDVDFQTREGWPGDTTIDLVRRQGRTIAPQLELSQHSLQADGISLQHNGLPESDLPVWHGVASRNVPDEIWMHLLFPGGIFIGSANVGRVPIRIRFRKKGDVAWVNVPEVHAAGNTTNQLRLAVLFKWATADPIPEPPTEGSGGFVYAYLNVPGQTAAPATPSERIWTSNSYFDDGVGNLYLYNGNAATTRIRNIALYDNRIEVFLDAGTFPKGIYEIQILRGSVMFTSNFGKNDYSYVTPGTIRDFFWYIGTVTPQISQNHSNCSDRGLLVRVVSIWNSPPLTVPGNFSMIALKALNRSVRQLSCVASGYVRDLSGSAPAPQLLLHFNGADTSTVFTDSSLSAHTITVSGSAQIDTAQSVFGGSSALMTSGSWTTESSSDFTFGTGDFTIDFRYRSSNTGSQHNLMGWDATHAIYKNTSNVINYYNSADVISGTTIVLQDTWYHVALVRSGGQTKLFVDGVQQGSTYADSNNYTGTIIKSPSDVPISGWIEEVRVIKGTAAWTSNFSVPIAEYSASGGTNWDTWTTTSNPAPHYVDVLSGSLNLDPLPADLRDDDALVAWRALCNTNNWTCDTIINDMRTQDVLDLLASCGFARPYQSDVYGVIVDNDRTLDAPIQVFSRRNCANLRYERSFARVPAGFNVTYRDESLDEDQAQVTVYQREPTDSDLTLLESVSYEGLIDVTKVTKRAQFDLDQANLRATFYYLDVDIESIVCRRGSLIAVEHDILFNRAGDGYIDSKQTSAGNITGITLDAEIPITTQTDMHGTTDLHLVTDMHDLGISTGIVIRRTDGTLSTHLLSNVTGSSKVLTFSTPFADVATIQGYANNDRRYGCMVVAGEMGSIYRRLLVQAIQPQKDLQATMVLVDEAPQLVR